MKKPAILILTFLSFNLLFSQKIGLVFSGGGAAGMAHIGVLKALEEHNIPIDYITGTSAGALVGALYSIGFSPNELEEMATSEDFYLMANGKVDERFNYYFKQPTPNASIINLKVKSDFNISKSLPTNFINPSWMDFYQMELFSYASAKANYDFDSLMIPFRCVASDIETKQQVVFCDGPINRAVRASMSYPFYLKPIVVDSRLLMDGGLYNNFPIDVMNQNFFPDIIIGSTVSTNPEKPDEDDIFSQMRSMVQNNSKYNLTNQKGIIITPKAINMSAFDFAHVQDAINSGYNETISQMDSIKKLIGRVADTTYIQKYRADFHDKYNEDIIINEIEVEGLDKDAKRYVEKILSGKSKKTQTINELKPKYFNLLLDDKIQFIYPTLIKNIDGYKLHLYIKKEPEINLRFGGNISSNTVNIGYFGIDYKYLGSVPFSVSANSYFGKFYSSLNLSSRVDFQSKTPFYIEPVFNLSRWDYYKNFATFFEDTKPPFLIQNEQYGGITIGLPYKNIGKINIDLYNGVTWDNYYQTKNFISTDTADRTDFYFNTAQLNYEINSLNKRLYPNKGTRLFTEVKYITGNEKNTPGSTSNDTSIFAINHEWFNFKLKYLTYLDLGLDYKLGIDIEGVYSSQSFFNNYTATVLNAPQYKSTPESRTLFIEEYSAYKYFAIGLKNVFRISRSIDLRAEGYYFQPVQSIIQNTDNKAALATPFSKSYFNASGVLVLHSFMGPLSLSLNYYDGVENPWSFSFNAGYILFNKKSIKY